MTSNCTVLLSCHITYFVVYRMCIMVRAGESGPGQHVHFLQRQPLATVHEYCTGRFWNIPPTEDSIFSRVMNKCAPPVEVHRNISLSEFAQAYDRFRAWLARIEDEPYSHEFFHVQGLIVKQLETQNIFDVKLSDIDAASLWQPRWVPALGKILTVRHHGACSLVSVRKVPDVTRFY